MTDEKSLKLLEFDKIAARLSDHAETDGGRVRCLELRPTADPEDQSQVGASIPGMVGKVTVKPGDRVEENQVIAIIEAMKMETSVVARMAGVIDEVLVKEGMSVKAGELLMTIKIK